MPVIKQRKVWARQPQIITGIDWSNPITRGLIHAYSRGFDYCQGNIPTNNADKAVFDMGVGDKFDAGGSKYVDLGKLLGATGEFTYVIWFHNPSEPSGYDNVLGLGDWANFRVKDSEFFTHNGSAWQAVDIGGGRGYRGDGFYKLVCVHAPPANLIYSVTPNLGRRVDINWSVSPRNNGASDSLRIGRATTTNRSFGGTVFVAHVLKRGVSEAEAWALLDNPWKIFRP